MSLKHTLKKRLCARTVTRITMLWKWLPKPDKHAMEPVTNNAHANIASYRHWETQNIEISLATFTTQTWCMHHLIAHPNQYTTGCQCCNPLSNQPTNVSVWNQLPRIPAAKPLGCQQKTTKHNITCKDLLQLFWETQRSWHMETPKRTARFGDDILVCSILLPRTILIDVCWTSNHANIEIAIPSPPPRCAKQY